jgi:type IV pilus assembly protein PilO
MNLKMPNLSAIRITARHWHYAAVALLCLVNLVLAVRLAYAWKRASAGNAARLEQHQMEYRAMQLKTRPLRGLDKKIDQAQLDEQAFYEKRFPATYSEVLAALGALAVKNNVLLSREQYAQGKLEEGVYELRMNANLTGDYAPIVRFINGLERDKIFFRIDGIALSGQQGGIVSLRMLLTTYLRAPAENAAGPTNASASAASTTAASHTTQPAHPAQAVHPTQPVHSTTERH